MYGGNAVVVNWLMRFPVLIPVTATGAIATAVYTPPPVAPPAPPPIVAPAPPRAELPPVVEAVKPPPAPTPKKLTKKKKKRG